MIKALLIDDETKARDMLAFLIDHYVPEITEYRVAEDGVSALALLETFQPDLVFLDIQMPKMSGFNLLHAIGRWEFDVIFTTAHHQYAIQAIKFSALDYLLKPIDPDELKAAVQRHLLKKADMGASRPPQTPLVENLLEQLQPVPPKSVPKLAIHTTEGTFFLKIDEIVRLEADRVYTHFYLRDNRRHLVSKPLREYEDLLEAHGFFRVHKSHLVNLAYADYYEAEGMLKLKTGGSVEVARRRKEEVLEALRK